MNYYLKVKILLRQVIFPLLWERLQLGCLLWFTRMFKWNKKQSNFHSLCVDLSFLIFSTGNCSAVQLSALLSSVHDSFQCDRFHWFACFSLSITNFCKYNIFFVCFTAPVVFFWFLEGFFVIIILIAFVIYCHMFFFWNLKKNFNK